MQVKTPDLKALSSNQAVGLPSFLAATERGRPEDIRTPFWNKEPRDVIVTKWLQVLKSHSDKLIPGLMDVELEQSEKVGPYSIMFPWKDREQDLRDYYELILTEPNVDKQLLRKAIALTCERLKLPKGRLRPRSFAKLKEEMKLNTNSGLYDFIKRRDAWDEAIALIESGRALGIPAVVGWRGQPVLKQRIVAMYPLATNILEAAYTHPVIEYLQDKNLVPEWNGHDAIDEAVTKFFEHKDPDDLAINTDFSKFDQHFNPLLFDIGKELWRYMFQSQYHAEIDALLLNVQEIPMLATTTQIYYGKHGMSSGSGFTSPLETLVHDVMQNYVALAARQELNPYNGRVGDDGRLSFKGITVKFVVDVYTKVFKQEANASKFYADKHSLTYLQHYYHDSYKPDGLMRGVYPTMRGLGRLLGQEYYHDPDVWSNEMVILRALSIIENSRWHPLFEEYIEFALEGDKYRLGLELPGFLDSIEDKYEAAKAKGVLEESYIRSFDNTGIADWAVIKYLKNKAKRLDD